MEKISGISKLQDAIAGKEAYFPMLEYFMKEHHPEFSFPEDTRNRIKQIRINTISLTAAFLGEYNLILKNFKAESIDFLLLKGLALEGLYPGGIRTFTDIDILLKKSDMPRAGAILTHLGYQEEIEPRHGAVNIRKSAGYIKKGQFRIILECHYRLGPSPYMDRIPPNLLFKNARLHSTGGPEMRVLSIEDTIIHLALHIFSHIPETCINSICDIRQVLKHHGREINWEILLEMTGKYRLALPVKFALDSVAEILNIPVPTYVYERLSASKTGRRERWAFILFQSEEKRLVNLAKISYVFRTTGKMKLMVYMMFPSREYILHKYGKAGENNFLFCYLRHIRELASSALSFLSGNF